MREYIKKSIKKTLRERKEWLLFKHIPIVVIKKLPSDIDLQIVIDMIEENIPSHFFSNIEGLYFGQFDELEDRKIKSMFKDSVIYVSNYEKDEVISEMLIAQDIIHEVAHAVEEKYNYELYGDRAIEQEFLNKRNKLYLMLKNQGIPVEIEDFMELDYKISFDRLLLNTIGYDKLSVMIVGLFLNPYSVTSLAEYFATGFEEYFSGDRDYLRDISKTLFNRIEMLGEKDGFTEDSNF